MKTYRNSSDEDLVRLSLQDKEVYFYLIKWYEPKLKRYILRTTYATSEEAEDSLQDIFIKVYRHLNGFDRKFLSVFGG